MAQASSVQREPSMEEILASIRRIIEDSESGRKEPQQGGISSEDKRGEVESFRAELKPVPEPAPSTFESKVEDERPAWVRLERPFDEPFAKLRREEPEAADEEPAPANDDGEPVSEPEAAEPPAFVRPSLASTPDARHTAPRASVPAPVAAEIDQPASDEAGRQGILSEASGRKVAAAFEELNEALMESRRKSLDQVAEEMLKPMLQEWLDNNLPQLVEKLVREEIERIARGG